MAKTAQPYVTENPEPRKVQVESEEKQGTGKVPVYEADPTRLDLSTDYPERETRVTLDEQVGPDHPAAVIVPPEGRGEHPQLWGVTDKTPEQLLADGEADEATGVLDGEVVTAEQAEKKTAAAEKKS